MKPGELSETNKKKFQLKPIISCRHHDSAGIEYQATLALFRGDMVDTGALRFVVACALSPFSTTLVSVESDN